MANPETFYFTLPSGKRPDLFPLNEQKHPAYDWLTSNRARERGGAASDAIDTIVIHATAGYATQDAIDTWRRDGNVASAHWIIPDEDEPKHGNVVWATVAEAKAARHVRDTINVSETVLGEGSNVNNRSLGIEIVNTQDVEEYRDPFSVWQTTMTARVVLYAWAKYPKLKHVISHAKLDSTRRADPGKKFPWMEFREAVLNYSALPNKPAGG
ncbi:MAG: N-acetylmuramoyl-L-alanine amidase [Drouetiella hepatica Uher 2000/2452]|jgi:N-acetylmuramoyl-L-alanine amidase|uniref:N-acetylmuramoyl-L-alanine amidase n=1 Tax=Drouetiella hepatica Uher 2000/2452 TaxID=904376 RepID=A0A951UNS6_9CYAN|nr:N-acetylmuramoyl-L-alanine amidase [Drouetiella hepatica Uher 2000/2452]